MQNRLNLGGVGGLCVLHALCGLTLSIVNEILY